MPAWALRICELQIAALEMKCDEDCRIRAVAHNAVCTAVQCEAESSCQVGLGRHARQLSKDRICCISSYPLSCCIYHMYGTTLYLAIY